MSRRALLAVCVCAAVTLATGYLGQAQVRDPAPVTDAMLQDPDPADWLSWRRTLDGWGYSPLDQIDRGNVDELRLAWSWGLEPGVSQTTPLVHDGFMYVANPGNVVQALDARTGDFVWEYRRLPGDLLPEERNPRGGSGVFVFALPAPQLPDLPGIVRVTIEGELSCPSCAAGLERRLRRLDYVAGVKVSPSDGQIVLAVEPGRHLDPAAVWDTVRNAGFIPDRMAVTAIGHVTDRNGTPALALSPDFALPLVDMDGLTATVTEAGDQLVKVTGHWNTSPDGAGRLQVESFEVR